MNEKSNEKTAIKCLISFFFGYSMFILLWILVYFLWLISGVFPEVGITERLGGLMLIAQVPFVYVFEELWWFSIPLTVLFLFLSFMVYFKVDIKKQKYAYALLISLCYLCSFGGTWMQLELFGGIDIFH